MRGKTILSIAALLIVLISSAYVISRVLLIGQFQDGDKNLISTKLDQLSSLVDESQAQLNQTTKFYANWDQSYDYIQNPDPDFINKNFLPVSLNDVKVQLVVFLDPTGKVVDGLSGNDPSETTHNIPEALLPFLA